MVWDAIPTLGGGDDRPPVSAYPGGGGDPLDGLVDVEVQGIAAIRGEDDVERSGNCLHCGVVDEGASRLVRCHQVSGEDCGDGVRLVQGHVQVESAGHQQGAVADLFPDGVAVGDAPGGTWIADVAGAVVPHDGLETGEGGHDHLGPTREAGEEVRFNEPGQDLRRARDELGIQQDFVAGGRMPDSDQ